MQCRQQMVAPGPRRSVLITGAFQPRERAKEAESLPMMDAFVSRRDLCQLILRAIAVEDVPFAIVHGLSNNRFNRMDLTATRDLLGYEPEDDFTELNPELSDLDLTDRVQPHAKKAGDTESGMREDLRKQA